MFTYVDANLIFECIIPEVDPVNFESLFINIIFHVNKRFIIGKIYRPPSAPSDSTKCILSTINSLAKHKELILLVDFNWLDRSSPGDKNFSSVNLTQLIKEPTRVDSRSSSLLDWILVSNPERILKSDVLSDCFSDHSVFIVSGKSKCHISLLNISEYLIVKILMLIISYRI